MQTEHRLHRLLALGLTLLLVGITACSADYTTVSSTGPASESVENQATTSSILAVPLDEEVRPGDPYADPTFNSDPWAALARNDNVAETPIGAVCWLRWELARSIMIEDLAGTVAGAQEKSSVDFKALTTTPIEDRLQAALGSHAHVNAGHHPDSDIVDFTSHIEQAARRVIDTGNAGDVSFERMPGFERYAELAVASADCVQP